VLMHVRVRVHVCSSCQMKMQHCVITSLMTFPVLARKNNDVKITA
jgi:hypothetical protein